MIPSNPRPKKPDKNRHHLSSTTRPNPLYQPSIYRYTCVGAYSATSQHRFSEGKCSGFRSRLELISDMEPATRQAALKEFTYMTDYELEDDGATGSTAQATGDAAEASLNQQTQSILVSPALIYKEDKDENDTNEKKKAGGEPLLPEEEVIKRQTWNCYGSTEVEYLVLKDLTSGSERVAAVAPRNAGVSIRKIDTDEASITSIGFGWLNIVVDTGPIYEKDEVDGEKQQEGVNNHSPEEVPPKPPVDALTAAKASVERLGTFSIKVFDQMHKNASWLSETLQDDFPQRTVTAGTKIVEQFPKTIVRTGKFMGKMAQRLFGDDPDEEEEGGGRR